ncbi:MAG: sensor histidine kinase [Acidimicrobiales bacterium]
MTRPGVLIVDDRPDNLVALEASLAPLDVSVTRAGSGAEALRQLLGEDFAVILLDVQMPDIDGFETARLIKNRSRTRHIPIIFLTAISREIEHQLRGYDAGAVDYLSKPFEPEVLRSKVSVFVALHEQSMLIAEQNRLLAERLEERNRAEAALSRHAVELQRSNAALDRFATATGHDLLAPLQVLSGMLELLCSDHGDRLSPDGRVLAERSQRRAADLAARVRQILAGARESLEPVRREATDLNRVLARAREQIESGDCHLGPEIAYSADPLPTVLGDEWELVQVFVQVLENAGRLADRERPEIHIGLSRQDDHWLISVADNGRGIGPAEQVDMFAVAVDGSADLSLSRRIVERHGGEIWVDAVDGRGTTMCFSLPA